MSDPERRALHEIFRTELEKHLGLLREEAGNAAWILSIESLVGAAGLVGNRVLAAALSRAARALREDEAGGQSEKARQDAIREVESALGHPEAASADGVWPNPPADLPPSAIDESLRTHYTSEVSDRLSHIDHALGPEQDAVSALLEVFRHVHTIKGAASAVGDAPMAWFCHGLEEKLRLVPREDHAATEALSLVGRYRTVLGALADDPAAAIAILRTRSGTPSLPPPSKQGDSKRPAVDDATVRVSTQAIERLLDRVVEMDWVRERAAAKTSRVKDFVVEIRRLRAEVEEALRLIGPPKPWGAPAVALRKLERSAKVLSRLGDDLDDASHACTESDAGLREHGEQMKSELSRFRHEPIGKIFRRLKQAVTSEAERADRQVDVRFVGAEEVIDRQLAEDLAEPLLQLARNAIAHGIEAPDEREAKGKERRATVTFIARKRSGRLLVSVTDDGAGVDLERVRKRAVQAGILASDVAEAIDAETLLDTLFLPGFSTRETPDMLAGRGIGLDIVLARIRRLGGTAHLASIPGEGMSAELTVPLEGSTMGALWVRAGEHRVAFLSTQVRRVCGVNEVPGDHAHLSTYIEKKENRRSAHLIELEAVDANGDPLFVGVDEILGVEEARVRALSPLVTRLGPFRAAMLRHDGTLCFVVDVFTLATRVRVRERRPSSFPGQA